MKRDHDVQELQQAAVKAKEPRVTARRCGVKRKPKFVLMHAMKAYRSVEVKLHAFLISAIDGQLHSQASLPQWKSYQCPRNMREG